MRAETDECIGEARALLRTVLVFNDVALRVNWNAVDGEQEIAALDAGTGTGRSRRYLDGSDAFGAGSPQDPILDLMPSGVSDNVRGAERPEKDGHGKRQGGAAPNAPPGLWRLRSSRARRQGVAGTRDWTWHHSLSI
jgi:hypothetical protein